MERERQAPAEAADAVEKIAHGGCERAIGRRRVSEWQLSLAKQQQFKMHLHSQETYPCARHSRLQRPRRTDANSWRMALHSSLRSSLSNHLMAVLYTSSHLSQMQSACAFERCTSTVDKSWLESKEAALPASEGCQTQHRVAARARRVDSKPSRLYGFAPPCQLSFHRFAGRLQFRN